MNKRKQAHKDADEQIDVILKSLDRGKYNSEQDYVLAVNMVDKVYRPYLHVITDAELDEGIEAAAVTIAMVELCVSMTAQMASRVVPEGDWKFARTWFGTVNNQIMVGNANSCRIMYPEAKSILHPGGTMQ